MNREPYDHVPTGKGELVDFFGHGFEFLRADVERTVLIDRLEPGGGVPLHVHHRSEERRVGKECRL